MAILFVGDKYLFLIIIDDCITIGSRNTGLNRCRKVLQLSENAVPAFLSEINIQARIIAEEFNPEKIILFGSYAYGKPTPDSDADLLVIVSSGRSTWELSADISLKIDHSFPLDILVKTKNEIDERLAKGDYFIEDIIKKGKVLYERTGNGMG